MGMAAVKVRKLVDVKNMKHFVKINVTGVKIRKNVFGNKVNKGVDQYVR